MSKIYHSGFLLSNIFWLDGCNEWPNASHRVWKNVWMFYFDSKVIRFLYKSQRSVMKHNACLVKVLWWMIKGSSGFKCSRIEWSGAYCFCPVCLFVCLSVVNSILCFNFWTLRDKHFIFGMHTPLNDALSNDTKVNDLVTLTLT